MGDRANIAVLQPNLEGQVVLYTHWGGSELPETLRQALLKYRERWDDAQYLARIILNEMQGDDRGGTGFGITTTVWDNAYPILVVDVDNQLIWTAIEKSLRDPIGPEISFDDYLSEERTWENVK